MRALTAEDNAKLAAGADAHRPRHRRRPGRRPRRGRDDYLVNPFSFAELAARPRALIRRGPLPRPVALTVGQLRLDPATREVRLAERRIDLTAKEFALLHTYVGYLREKLGRSAIETVRGAGYRLRAETPP